MGKYDDIIDLPHHVSDYHRRMTMENRAAQFAPFAALTGHEDALAETARETQEMKELSEIEINGISRKLHYAIENRIPVRITYFLPDKTKSGGTYREISGSIKKRDEISGTLIFEDSRVIPISFISDIVEIEVD